MLKAVRSYGGGEGDRDLPEREVMAPTIELRTATFS